MKKRYLWAETFLDSEMTPRQKLIANRLKEYDDMKSAYAEIEDQVDEKEYPKGRDCVLTSIINAALISEGKKDLRKGPNGLKDINDKQNKIAEHAETLAVLLDERDKMIDRRYKTSKAIITPIRLYIEAGLKMKPAERRLSFKGNRLSLFRDYRDYTACRSPLPEPTLSAYSAQTDQ